MHRILLIALASASLAVAADPSAKQLFNGRDMTGWQHVGPGSFTLENGMLKTHGGMGLLWYTPEKFGNCVLRVVFHTNTLRDNSGVFIRILDKPKEPWYAVHFGYEVQIEDGADDFHRTGVIYSMVKALAKPPIPPDGWHTMEITLDGQHTVAVVNGVKVTDFHGNDLVPPRKMWYEPERGPRPDIGYIGLQNHDERTTIEFKEVSIHPLSKSAGRTSH
jgi:hypothetical protein